MPGIFLKNLLLQGEGEVSNLIQKFSFLILLSGGGGGGEEVLHQIHSFATVAETSFIT